MSEAAQAPRLTAAHLSLAAIGLMWTLPFLQPYHHIPLTSFYSEWLALALGLVALTWMARGAFWRGAPLSASLVPVLGFVALLFLQHFAGKVAYGGQVLVAGLYLLWAVMLAVLAGGLRRSIGLEGVVTVLAWFLLIGGAVGALLGLLQHYQISDLPQSLVFPKGRIQVYGNLAQNNHFANYSTLALVSLAYLYASRRLHIAAAAAAALPLLFVIGLSGSRSALLFFAWVLALALAYAWRGGAGGRRVAGSVVLLMVVFALLQWVVTLSWFESAGGAETVTQRLASSEDSAGAKSLAFRAEIAREAWEMFMQAPILGVGWGQFPWHDFQFRALEGSRIYFWPFHHAHNIVLHLLAETGLTGILLFGAAGLLWLRCLKRATIDLPHWWLAALIGVIAIHSLLEHPLWFAYFLGVAAVAMGLMEPGDFKARLERAGAPLMALLIVAGAVYAVSVFDNYRSFERLFARGAPAPDTAEFAAVVGRTHREPALRPYAELAIATGMSLDRERVREKVEISARVMRFAPLSTVAYRHAVLLALAGDGPAAERALASATRIYPQDLPAMIKVMSEVARQHPAELAPLLKLAAAKHAERR